MLLYALRIEDGERVCDMDNAVKEHIKEHNARFQDTGRCFRRPLSPLLIPAAPCGHVIRTSPLPSPFRYLESTTPSPKKKTPPALLLVSTDLHGSFFLDTASIMMELFSIITAPLLLRFAK
jgi:hypothetical protein